MNYVFWYQIQPLRLLSSAEALRLSLLFVSLFFGAPPIYGFWRRKIDFARLLGPWSVEVLVPLNQSPVPYQFKFKRLYQYLSI